MELNLKEYKTKVDELKIYLQKIVCACIYFSSSTFYIDLLLPFVFFHYISLFIFRLFFR